VGGVKKETAKIVYSWCDILLCMSGCNESTIMNKHLGKHWRNELAETRLLSQGVPCSSYLIAGKKSEKGTEKAFSHLKVTI